MRATSLYSLLSPLALARRLHDSPELCKSVPFFLSVVLMPASLLDHSIPPANDEEMMAH